uniref:Mitogen-activated protein kinase kinase kinase 4 n=1 Tax=Plutella xylostella TaxID=51655 RepID=A0A8E4NIS2_PLUXY|nr:mitogen-activated protein kinase kinase kinase 4 [Plutella xylostella]
MKSVSDNDWKQSVGFPINYDSELSSDDNFDVVIRRSGPRSSLHLLEDEGDGAPADLLGTTPPRARIRSKEKRRTILGECESAAQKGVVFRNNRRNTVDNFYQKEIIDSPERVKKRATMMLARSRERDLKLELGERADSNPPPALPTLVESCNRFMSLTSRLKCSPDSQQQEPLDECRELPQSRVNFHKTFSLLINMGASDKGARRTISREEQVWQNELKDLIWLELQAVIAGRSLAQQDAYLCAQRSIVPAVVKNIMEYRFINTKPCAPLRRKADSAGEQSDTSDFDKTEDEKEEYGCLSFDCQPCADAIGKCLREVGTLLDSFYNAVALYPSSKAMTVEHPLIATTLFKNRLKAMCLWYNIALHMRMKMVAIRKLIRTMMLKERHRYQHLQSVDSDSSRQSDACLKPCQVRFNLSLDGSPTDSSTSEGSVNDAPGAREKGEGVGERAGEKIVRNSDPSAPPTPEIILPDSGTDTTDTTASHESGYHSDGVPRKNSIVCDDVYNLTSLEELTSLSLLAKCEVSPYRHYLSEILKTQGVRRSMMFIQKLRKYILQKVYMTFEKPDSAHLDHYEEEEPAEGGGAREGDEDARDEEVKNAYELRRYGCWSPESLAMNLPSYRGHFLLLSTVSMEVVHDYLALRLHAAPHRPSCLTIKQMIHELKEGIDIATDIRAVFVRNIETALDGYPASDAAKEQLILLITTFDTTIENVLKQYLSYLTTISAANFLPRACLQDEWAFTARLAKRVKCVAVLAPVSFTDIVCNQIDRLLKQFTDNFKDFSKREEDYPSDEEDVEAMRHFVYQLCREAHSIYASHRDMAIQTVQFARVLAARTPPAFTQERDKIFESLMSYRECIVQQTVSIVERSGRVPAELSKELVENVNARLRELLLQVFRLGFEIHREIHKAVSSSVSRGRPRVMRAQSTTDDVDPLCDTTQTQIPSSIELLLSNSEPSPPSVSAAALAQAQEQWARRAARGVVQFAMCWMKFVTERCERGRGLRPRWANQGLEFLMLACDPYNTKYLTDVEFEDLKQCMDRCITHVIGSRDPARAAEPAASPQHGRHHARKHSPKPPGVHTGAGAGVPTPPTPPTEPEPVLNFHGVETSMHRRRVQDAIQRLDSARDSALRNNKAVGRVLESEAGAHSYEPKLRQVTFKWQRGLKIGQGTFGKVYTVINTETGQLLAMKELAVGAGDRRLPRACNELRVLEGVTHPHLVRYHGAELHREEMLIFMELCVEGSLEALVATSGGLPEPTVRKYTKQLVSAILELHNRQIAHRDIKSGNIFLTNEGHCLKLGDFGCAVKIRANTTAVGELQGTVGTQAYMAPEVFMKSSGHGRAADIWSLGCVVTEMASGKRPFSEYDSNYQIMFVVGMGGRPEPPASLSAEGAAFCRSCLTHEPEARPAAHELATHHFLMIKSDDDCNCEPGYFKTKM